VKNERLFARVELLSRKLDDSPPEGLLVLDSDCYSEAEKALFKKAEEISEEYHRTGDIQVLVKNDDLTAKCVYVIFKRLTELYSYTMPQLISAYTLLDQEIVNYFFKLHFSSFEADLIQCLNNLQSWKTTDCQEFLSDLKTYGPPLPPNSKRFQRTQF